MRKYLTTHSSKNEYGVSKLYELNLKNLVDEFMNIIYYVYYRLLYGDYTTWPVNKFFSNQFF